MSRPVEAFLPGGLDGQPAQKLARFPLDLLHAPDPLPPQFTDLFRKAQENPEDVRAQGGFHFGNPAYALAFSLEIPAGEYLLCGDLGACGGGKFAGIPVTPYAPVSTGYSHPVRQRAVRKRTRVQ